MKRNFKIKRMFLLAAVLIIILSTVFCTVACKKQTEENKKEPPATVTTFFDNSGNIKKSASSLEGMSIEGKTEAKDLNIEKINEFITLLNSISKTYITFSFKEREDAREPFTNYNVNFNEFDYFINLKTPEYIIICKQDSKTYLWVRMENKKDEKPFHHTLYEISNADFTKIENFIKAL